MKNRYSISLILLAFTIALLTGCGAQGVTESDHNPNAGSQAFPTDSPPSTADSHETASAAPKDSDIIMTIEGADIPYGIYRHYYQAMALQLAPESGTEWTEEELSRLSDFTENLLMEDYVYYILADRQDIHLTDEERAALDTGNAAANLKELLQFRLEAQALRTKIFTTMYQKDYLQTAIHVQSLFLPYSDQTDTEITNTRELASLTARLYTPDMDFEEFCKPLIDGQNAVFSDIYLTDGDMGQGAYDLAADLEMGCLSQPFTLAGDGVYLLRRIPVDEDYIAAHLDELLGNSAQFSSLYQMLVEVTRQSAEIIYTDLAAGIRPQPGGSPAAQ